jgi:hypothetical protein
MSAEVADPSAAAMFARKRKGQKKVFKFNANKVDASQVISTIHIDAPAVSTNDDVTAAPIITSKIDTSGDWDEGALASKATRTTASVIAGSGPAELLDMKALELNRSEQDDIAERMRVEETRAQLAAAKAGMEKEAQRLREEQEAKEAKKKERETTQSSRFGAAAATLSGESGGIGSKWVPPHMRNAAPPSRSSGIGIGSSRFGAAMGSSAPGNGFQKKVDTMDEELFPSLATADMMLAQEEEQKAAQAAALKAKMAGVPAWGAKKKPVIKKEERPVEEAKPEPVAAPGPAPAASAAPAVKSVLKKKKKKDLSTFKVN